jgi:hypothetical protein
MKGVEIAHPESICPPDECSVQALGGGSPFMRRAFLFSIISKIDLNISKRNLSNKITDSTSSSSLVMHSLCNLRQVAGESQ